MSSTYYVSICVELKEGVVERDVEKNVECFFILYIYIFFLYFEFLTLLCFLN